jgi:hypothetical protein
MSSKVAAFDDDSEYEDDDGPPKRDEWGRKRLAQRSKFWRKKNLLVYKVGGRRPAPAPHARMAARGPSPLMLSATAFAPRCPAKQIKNAWQDALPMVTMLSSGVLSGISEHKKKKAAAAFASNLGVAVVSNRRDESLVKPGTPRGVWGAAAICPTSILRLTDPFLLLSPRAPPPPRAAKTGSPPAGTHIRGRAEGPPCNHHHKPTPCPSDGPFLTPLSGTVARSHTPTHTRIRILYVPISISISRSCSRRCTESRTTGRRSRTRRGGS